MTHSGAPPSGPGAAMRNVWVLCAAQALAGCGTIMLVAFGGIVGTRIAPSPALATLPLSLSVLGVASMSLPAALLMQRFGRKTGFVGSAAVAVCGALLCAYSVASSNFWSLCAAAFMLGGNMAFVQQYRFAATEYVSPEHAGRAVATVMLGTLAAAFAGPLLGELARDFGGYVEFTGSFLVLALLCAAAAAVLTLLEPAPLRTVATSGSSRPLAQIAAQTDFRIAVLSGLVAYAVMSFIMTATPISMHVHDGFSSGQTSAVISAHLIGMYLPSLATPLLVRWLRIRGMMLLGLAAMALCVGIAAFVGHAFVHYFAGLVLLGLGWNLLFVAGTTLLTTTYSSAERFRAQGFNDLTVFGSQAIASLFAGSAIEALGWTAVNVVTLPLLLLAAVGVLRMRSRAR